MTPAQADDMLTSALKKISELEAKNIALEVNHRRLEDEYKTLKERNNKLEKTYKAKEASSIKLATKPRDKFASKAVKEPSSLITSTSNQSSRLEETTKVAFEGAYAGLNGGYGGGDVQSFINTYTVSTNGSAGPWNSSANNAKNTDRYGGALVGGQIGYNYILPNHIFLGGEYDFNWANIANRNSNAQLNFGGFNSANTYYGVFGSSLGSNTQTSLNWISTARIRVGYQSGSLLPYLTGGFAFGNATNSLSGYAAGYQLTISSGSPSTTILNSLGSGSNSRLLTGWAAGAGVEYAILQNLSLKTEYLFTQLGSLPQNNLAISFPYPNNNLGFSVGSAGPLGFHQIRVGLNYHPYFFDTPAPAVVAKY